MNISKLLFCSAAVLAIAGCSGGAVRVEEDFGNSVRGMVEAQVNNPEAVLSPYPSAELPGGIDGARGDKVIEGYRDPKPPRPALSRGYSPL